MSHGITDRSDMSRLFPRYPRTHHLEGSRVPAGEVNTEAVPFLEVEGKNLVIEEKVDGSHAGICFDPDANLAVFSRNTIIREDSPVPGMRDLLRLATVYMDDLWEVLEDRYILYGEWMLAKHTIFYDAVPQYFLEDDIYDRETGRFLSTPERQKLVARLPEPFRHSVPVLASGTFDSLDQITRNVGVSKFKTPEWRIRFAESCQRAGLDPMDAMFSTDDSDLMEGLYIKLEEDGEVVARYKWVRYEFVRTIVSNSVHWTARDIVRNAAA